MMRRSLTVAFAALLALTAACSSDSKTSTSSGSSSSSASSASGPQTLGIDVDAKATDTSVAFLAYFPSAVTAHPGDTLDFASSFTGEPHTVAFGTLVDQGLAKSDPNASDEPPELKKIPDLLPQGPGDAVQAVAQPCFLPAGQDPPASDACTAAQQKQPAFDGTQSFYNSGFLAEGDHFKVTLSDSIKPGTYSYFCTLHRAGMTGKITVVAAGDKADTPAEVKAAGQKEHTDALDKLKPTLEAIKAGTLPPFVPAAAPGGVIAGGGSQDVQNAVPVLFGPATVSVKAGEAVTWTIVGPHTISFGASEALRTIIAKAPDGAVHLNPDSFAPAGGAGQPAPDPSAPPPASDAPPTLIDGGSYDGTGFHSSGVVVAFPPNIFQYKLTFTKAGTYSYVCLVHPDMKGVVNVT